MREPPADPGGCALAELADLWLDVSCGSCGRVSTPPLRLLGKKLGTHHRLRDVVVRFSCEHCGARPKEVYLQSSPNWGASGMGRKDHGWRVVLDNSKASHEFLYVPAKRSVVGSSS